MFEGLFGCDAAFGIVDEYAAEEIDELFVEIGALWDDVLYIL